MIGRILAAPLPIPKRRQACFPGNKVTSLTVEPPHPLCAPGALRCNVLATCSRRAQMLSDGSDLRPHSRASITSSTRHLSKDHHTKAISAISATTGTFHFLRAAETRARNRAEAASNANDDRVSGKNLWCQVPNGRALLRVSTAEGPETISPWLCGHHNGRQAEVGFPGCREFSLLSCPFP